MKGLGPSAGLRLAVATIMYVLAQSEKEPWGTMTDLSRPHDYTAFLPRYSIGVAH